MRYLIGIDNGGTISKTAVLTEGGRQNSAARVPRRTHPSLYQAKAKGSRAVPRGVAWAGRWLRALAPRDQAAAL